MSLAARHLEALGIPTLCLGSALDILQAGAPPRSVFIDYPLGHSAGKPFDRAESEQAIRALIPGTLDLAMTGVIQERSGGNPLFLEELCQSLPRGGPLEAELQVAHHGLAGHQELVHEDVPGTHAETAALGQVA